MNEDVLRLDQVANIAKAIVDHMRHKYWFSEDILARLTYAALGCTPHQAAEAMERVLLTERRVPLNDDPHDGWGLRP